MTLRNTYNKKSKIITVDYKTHIFGSNTLTKKMTIYKDG